MTQRGGGGTRDRRRRDRGARRLPWRIAGFVVIVGVLWAAVAAVTAYAALRDLQTGRADAERGRDLVLERDLDRARYELDKAHDRLSAAEDRLSGPIITPLRVLPVIGPNVNVVRDLAASGAFAAAAGEEMARAVAGLDGGAEALAPDDGALPVDAFADLADPLRRADALLRRSVRILRPTFDVPVDPTVARARADLADVIVPAAATTDRLGELLTVLPEFLGADGPRRYLVVPQNPAELRGTGGFIGAYAIATLDDGRFTFSQVGSTDDLPSYPASEVVAPNRDFAARYNRYGGAGFWKNINLTPDFPSAARAMETLYTKGTGDTVDGVIAADPFTLEAMLEVSGPVDVPRFGSVSADEVVAVVSNQAYDEITDPDVRKTLLGEVFVQAFLRFLEEGGEGDPLRTAQVLGETVREGHLLVHATDPDTQAAMLRAGVGGALRNPGGDFLAVIVNAGSASKLDYYLERDDVYRVQLHPDGSVTAQVDIGLRNAAPTSGVDRYVIGPNVEGLDAGENRVLLSVYGPEAATLEQLRRSRGSEPVRVESELGHSVFTTLVELPSGASERVVMDTAAAGVWARQGESGRYQLTVQAQATIRPVDVHVVIELPDGMVATGLSPGLGFDRDGNITYVGAVSPVSSFEVQFAPEGTARALRPPDAR